MSESSPACQGPRGPAHAAICSLVAPFHAVVSPLSRVPRGNSVAVSNVRASDSELPRRPPRASLRPAPGACAGWSDGARTPQRGRGGAPSHRPAVAHASRPAFFSSRSTRVTRSRVRRRSTASRVEPGPRPPMPPASRDGETSARCASRGSRYLSCPSSTCSLPSSVVACCATMARMSGVRFYQSQLHALAQVTRRVGVRASSTIRRSTSLWKARMASWSSLSDVSTVLGSTRNRFCVYDVDDVDPRRVGRIAQSCDMDIEVPGAAAGGGRDQDRVLEICDVLRAGMVRDRGLRDRGSTPGSRS